MYWKDIDVYGGDYQVSNYGRIKSFIEWHGTDIRILTQIKVNGYLRVNLCKNGKCGFKKIHRLLFETFYNYKLKEGECIHHINKNSLNNYLDNLQLMVKSEHHSFHNSGENHPFYGKHHSEKTKQLMSEKKSRENHPSSVLAEQDAIKIRELSDEGNLTQREIAKLFGVAQPIISYIKNGKIWKNV